MKYWNIIGQITIKLDSVIADPNDEGGLGVCVALATAEALRKGELSISGLTAIEMNSAQAHAHSDKKTLGV